MSKRFNLGDLLDRDADPQETALVDLVDPAAPRIYTHGDLDAAARALARGLLARGLRSGDHVAILAANSAAFLIVYLGTMRAGMIAVPVNHKFPRETVHYILNDAGCRLVFADAARRHLVPPGLDCVSLDDASDGLDALLDPGPFESVRPGDGEIAMFLYTSGSTGRPKGVPLTHAGHLWVVEMRIRRRPDPDHRLLVAAPLYHMNGLAICKMALAAHLRIVLLPQFTAADYIRAIGTHRVTWLTSVAAMMAMVVREEALLARMDLSSVRIVRMGSAPVSAKLVADIRAVFPGAEIANGYGTTEAGPVVYGPHPGGIRQPDISVGYPIAGMARLVCGASLEATEGELHCRNPAVTPGYHNLPEKTAEAMTADGWYRTGDLMRCDDDGFHYFVGRVDDMFNCGGENIYPSEVEKLLERHQAVEQACVVPVADDIKGFKPVAFVVARPGTTISEAEIKAHALGNGPAYQHPRRVIFLDSLPLTGTSKVDRNDLARRAAGELG